MKKKLRLKSYVIYSLYVVLFLTVTASMMLVSTKLRNSNNKENDYTYVSNEVVNQDIPVINETKKMINPYLSDKVKVGKNYYDYKAESEKQEKSITYYDGKYIQNSGIDFIADEQFDVVTVLEGTVVNVKKDDVVGNIVEIKHENNYITTYQSLSEVSVKKDELVSQGQIIGKSGVNKIDKDMGNHLHFELYMNGQIVDPQLYLDKEIKKEQ